MSAEVFFDTNILVYAACGAGIESGKREHALRLIETVSFAISAQVLQEFFVTVVKKGSRPLRSVEAMEWIEELSAFPCQTIDYGIVVTAIEISARRRISYWDAAILAAAKALGCRLVYSEDFSHGADYDGVKVVNPFREEK
jgi:predicted nucleic acid-binding protein